MKKRLKRIALFIPLWVCLFSCTGADCVRVIESDNQNQLLLIKEKIMVELAWQTEYHLALKNHATSEIRKITGRYGTLPKVCRYLSRIRVERMDAGEGSLFNTPVFRFATP